jgi:peptide-methionine (R)-S-oxide reductase
MSQGLPEDDEGWRKRLTPEQHHVLRQGGTERPFTGALLTEHRLGAYHCAGCQKILFRAEDKFESGCGWPSFSQSAHTEGLLSLVDHSHGVTRTEIRCPGCEGHLGHVFPDGPEPTGLRYCINSLAMSFQPDD